jgi:hypothetical protein
VLINWVNFLIKNYKKLTSKRSFLLYSGCYFVIKLQKWLSDTPEDSFVPK